MPTRPPKPVKPEGLDTPGLNWRPRNTHWVAVWVARADIVAKGYSLKSQRLWPPSNSKRVEPDADEWNAIASLSQRHQAEMLEWANEGPKGWDPRAVFDGTLGSLIDIYQKDPDGPFQKLRIGPRKCYISNQKTLKAGVSSARIVELDFRAFLRMHESFSKPARGRDKKRPARGYAMIQQLRILLSFGALLKLPGCKEARETLSEMEFDVPKKRKTIVNAPQCALIRQEAHRIGLHSIALTQGFEWGLGARQKDIIGEFVPMSEPGLSRVHFNNKKWLYGADWNEIDGEFYFEHRLSKSLRGRDAIADPDAGKVKRWNLRSYPVIMEELALLAGCAVAELRRDMFPASGPVVVCEENGRPWTSTLFGERWRKIATAVGVPTNVQNRDTRAGAASDAEALGAPRRAIATALGHEKEETTGIYTRADDEVTEKVAILRFGTDGKRA